MVSPLKKLRGKYLLGQNLFLNLWSVEIATEQFKDFNSRAFTGLNIFLVETLLSKIDNSGN